MASMLDDVKGARAGWLSSASHLFRKRLCPVDSHGGAGKSCRLPAWFCAPLDGSGSPHPCSEEGRQSRSSQPMQGPRTSGLHSQALPGSAPSVAQKVKLVRGNGGDRSDAALRKISGCRAAGDGPLQPSFQADPALLVTWYGQAESDATHVRDSLGGLPHTAGEVGVAGDQSDSARIFGVLHRPRVGEEAASRIKVGKIMGGSRSDVERLRLSVMIAPRLV